MTFVVRMALREIRASWRRLLFFFVCIAIGVGSIVALRSVIQSVRAALAGEARALLSADLLVSSNNAFTPEVRDTIAREQRDGRITERSESVELSTMVRPATGEGTRMVELRAVQPEFPMYGTLRLQDGSPYTHALLRGGGALVRPELLAQFGSRVGRTRASDRRVQPRAARPHRPRRFGVHWTARIRQSSQLPDAAARAGG
jgi:putative ABC transport system permease protein